MVSEQQKETLTLNACKDIGLAVNTGSRTSSRHDANEHKRAGSNACEKAKTFKYLSSLLTNQNSIHEEIKCRVKAENSCYIELKHICLLDFSLKIRKLKYIKQYFFSSCAMWL
jgi:hypothetical protein